MLFSVLLLCLLPGVSAAVVGCAGPLDCNARRCADCECDNGACVCADGWSGDGCNTPFCVNRTTGCNGHGNCNQTAQNITCACDQGWAGPHCTTALGCRNATDCNGDNCIDCACTKGGSCACSDGWSGKRCEIPFCTNRTSGCSGHGDCHQRLRNISCTCDSGWTGANCSTASPVCTNATECNSHNCVDCACTSGSCVCADGWSGPGCRTPFCLNRSDCSGHGDCHMQLHGIVCECDAGWHGPKCASPSPSPPGPSPSPPSPSPSPSPSPPPGPSPAPTAPQHPPVPGAFTALSREGALFGHGYDPITGEFRGSVADLSFTGLRGTDPFLNDWQHPTLNTTHTLPDQVFIYSLPGSDVVEDKQIIANTTVFNHWMSHYHYSVFIGIIINTAHVDVEVYADGVLASGLNSAIVTHGTKSLFKVDLWSPNVLRGEMQPGGSLSHMLLAKEQPSLPSTRLTDEDKAAYAGFIQRHGTHYVSSATFGGGWMSFIDVEEKVRVSYKLEVDLELSADLILFFFSALSIRASAGIKAQLNTTFRKNAEVLIASYGGDPTAIMHKDAGEWSLTIGRNPAPVNVSFTPMYELLADPLKSQLLKEATEEYLRAGANQSKPNAFGPDSNFKTICGSPPGISFTVDDLPDPTNLTRPAPSLATLSTAAVSPFSTGTVGHGFDLRAGRALAPLGAAPSYTQRKQFYYPFNNVTYQVPDGATVASSPLGCARFGYQLFLSAEAVADFWLKGSVGSVGITIFGIHVGLTWSELRERFFAELDAQGMAMVSFEMGYELLKAAPDLDAILAPNTPFSRALAALPEPNATGSDEAYQAFLGRWGTHYVASQGFGGYCNFTAKFSAAMVAKFSETLVLRKAGLSIGFLFAKLKIAIRDHDWNKFFNASHDFNWTSHIEIDFHCQGGDPSILGSAANPNNGSFPRWLKSVLKAPVAIDRPTARRLDPIAGLVTSSLAKRKALHAATAVFLSKNNTDNKHEKKQKKKQGADNTDKKHETKQGADTAANPAAALTPGEAAQPSTDTNGLVLRWVPGVCNGIGGVGLGCGFDITNIAAFGSANVNPMRPVVYMPHCKLKCYVNPPPLGDPDCEGCLAEPVPAAYMPDGKPMMYRVPSNVGMKRSPIAGACFDSHNFSYVDDYQAHYYKKWSHHGFFSSHSKTVKHFYHQYFEQDNSLSVAYLFNEWHTLFLDQLVDAPTWGFRTAVANLPLIYKGHEAEYRSFLQQFGTHYMDTVSMGGSALLTAYYHSCFLNTYNTTDILTTSRHSFFIFFNSGSGTHKHTDINNTQWQHWSKIELQLSGGEVLGHGRLTKTNTMSREQCAKWEQTIKANRMVPLQYNLRPITDLMRGQKLPFNPLKIYNVNRSIAEYIQNAQADNDNLAKALMPKDPYCVPPWCKFSPKPDFPVHSSVPLPPPPPPPYGYCNRTSAPNRMVPRRPVGAPRPQGDARDQVGDLPVCPGLLSRDELRQLTRTATKLS